VLWFNFQNKQQDQEQGQGDGSPPATGDSASAARTPEELETEEAKKLVEKLTESGAAARDEESTREVVAVAARAVRSLSDSEFDITFNPDVFQDHVKHTEPEV